MGKTYSNVKTDSIQVAEPACAYGVSSSPSSSEIVTKKESVMPSTMSVDEYFDELISLVHINFS